MVKMENRFEQQVRFVDLMDGLMESPIYKWMITRGATMT